MPPEDVRLLTVDKVSHSLDPWRCVYCFKSSILCILDHLKHITAFLNTAGGIVLIGAGREGRICGLFDDDLRTSHHYMHRLSETVRKKMGSQCLANIEIKMIQLGSEDLCMVSCRKSDVPIVCTDSHYNKMTGADSRRRLKYERHNAITKIVSELSDDSLHTVFSSE